MNGADLLKAWMERSKLSQRKAATMLGMHFTNLNKILTKHRSVGLVMAVQIQRITGVPIESWTDTGVGRRRRVWSEHERKQLVGKK